MNDRQSVLMALLLVSSAAVQADIYSAQEALNRGDTKAAIEEFRSLADQGDAKAQAQLGYIYYTGEGVALDYAEAVKWYQKAAAQGDRGAQYNLAVAYAFGEGVTQDYSQAALWYRRAAEQGHVEAQYSLGLSYSYGEGVAQDAAEATQWFRKAADQGYVRAQVHLGSKYHTGDGVPQDYKEAVKWYRMAADRGDAVAQYNLGSLYRSGMGVERDYNQALRWFRMAADRGYAAAQSELASLERAIAAQSRPRPAPAVAPSPAVSQSAPASRPAPAPAAAEPKPAPQAQASAETGGRDALFSVDKSDLLSLDSGETPPETQTATAEPASAPESEATTADTESTSETAAIPEDAAAERKSGGVLGFLGRLFRPGAAPPESTAAAEPAAAETATAETVEPEAAAVEPESAATTPTEPAQKTEAESELLAMESLEPSLPDTEAPPDETLLADSSAPTGGVEEAAPATEPGQAAEESKPGFFKRLFSRKRDETEPAAEVAAAAPQEAELETAMAETETTGTAAAEEAETTVAADAPEETTSADTAAETAAEEPERGYFRRLFGKKQESETTAATETSQPEAAARAEGAESGTAVTHAADISNGTPEATPLESPEENTAASATTPPSTDALAVDLGEAGARADQNVLDSTAEEQSVEAAPEPEALDDEETVEEGEKQGFFKRLFSRQEKADTPAVPEEIPAEETVAMVSPEAGAGEFRADAGELDAALRAVQAGKYADAFPVLRSFAAQGDPVAQFRVGTLYHQGLGVERDLSAAAQWYRRSAEQGNADAEYSLANMYLMGEGLEQDYGKARQWYQQAAAQGHEAAKHNLSNLDRISDDAGEAPEAEPVDDTAAAETPAQSAEPETGDRADEGDKPGFFRRLFNRDAEPPQESSVAPEAAPESAAEPQAEPAPTESVEQEAAAESPASESAQAELPDAEPEEGKSRVGRFFGRLFGDDEEESDAQPDQAAVAEAEAERAAASPGESSVAAIEEGTTGDTAESAYEKGVAYSVGEGVEKDPAMALQWYLAAAEMGHAGAQYKVGAAYAYGEGTARDPAKAVEWYQKAAAQGYAIAQRNLGGMYMTGEGVEQNKTLALAWYSVLADVGNVMDIRRRDTLMQELSENEVAEAQYLAASLKAEIQAAH
ncbi:MAG: SEL1-like repeat protein [Gammaproteobacteria bacterium]|nr:SEL1-like repeat protein [Gammaproteobacteria bacterium]